MLFVKIHLPCDKHKLIKQNVSGQFFSTKMSDSRSLHTQIQERCVVILGKTGSGKSTIANMIMGYDLMSENPPTFKILDKVWESETEAVNEATTEFRQNDIVYRVRVIDTPGLFGTPSDDHNKTMRDLYDKLAEHFKDHFIVGANLILFVCKKATFTEEEQTVFRLIMRTFHKEIRPISALFITHCEAESAETRKDTLRKFEQGETTKEIALQMGKGLYAVGFPPLKQMSSEFQELCRKKIKKDKETLMDLIIRSKTVRFTRELFQKQHTEYYKCSIL